VEVTCRSAAEPAEHAIRARVANISLGGVKLHIDRSFRRGELLALEVLGPPDQAVAPVLTGVVHVAETPGGQWCVGCLFVAELTDDELGALHGQRVRTTPPDQRHWTRFPCDATAHCEVLGEPSSGQTQVVDVSPTGARLRLRSEVRVGALLLLEVGAGDGHPGFTKPACVVHAAPAGNGEWTLGCLFIRTLSSAEYQAFR
jgi:hypothetical protein